AAVICMAGGGITDWALPPQWGHFFRCGPATFSIFSVLRPHFRHLYSYKGTDTLPFSGAESKSIPRARESFSTGAARFRSRVRLLSVSKKRPRHDAPAQTPSPSN